MKNYFQEIQKLENAYDQKDSNSLQLELQNKSDLSSIAELLIKTDEEGYREAISFGKNVFKITTDPILRCFIHYWVLGCMDVLYLPEERKDWLKEWIHLDSTVHPWFPFVRKFQMAMGLYHESFLRDSLALFEQLAAEAKTISYLRGMEKSNFQIALIYKCMNQFEKAKYFFDEALKIAYLRKSQRRIEKIQDLKNTLVLNHWHTDHNLSEIESYLKLGQLRKARKLLLHALKVRRIQGFGREAQSETMYMALVSLGFGNIKRFYKLFHYFIPDNVLKEKTLTLAIEYKLTIPNKLVEEQSYLRRLLGIYLVPNNQSSEFLGVKLDNVKDREAVKVVLKLISDLNGISKEEFCTHFWNYNYDPVIHDPKIYNLIYRVKKVFKCKDLIISNSGLYRINPKYVNI